MNLQRFCRVSELPDTMPRKTLILLLLAAVGLSACASDKLVGRPGLTILQNSELPPPTQDDDELQHRTYRVGPGDKLSILTYGIEELSAREVLVDANGDIGLPLAGTLPAAGRTPAELAGEIEAAFRARQVRAPIVTVSATASGQYVTVEGQVKEPGLYPVVGQMTLIRAVASAKGLTEIANTNFVVIYRDVGSQKMAALYDLRAIRQGIYPDPQVYPNDIVTIGEAGGRRAFPTIVQGAALLVTPIVALLN